MHSHAFSSKILLQVQNEITRINNYRCRPHFHYNHHHNFNDMSHWRSPASPIKALLSSLTLFFLFAVIDKPKNVTFISNPTISCIVLLRVGFSVKLLLLMNHVRRVDQPANHVPLPIKAAIHFNALFSALYSFTYMHFILFHKYLD